jgi:hypothetical protein
VQCAVATRAGGFVGLHVRYRFKGIVRASGQTVEGHAHGDTPDNALAALSEHGIVTESLREDPEPLNMNAAAEPLSSAIDSALDTAASQVPFDEVAKRYTGKNVWVLDRDKIRKRVAQVVDQAIRDSLGDSGSFGSLNVSDLRKQVADAIGGLFKDNRNLTSQVSNTSVHLDHQVKRIETLVHRAESVLAQMTVAISRMGSMGGGGGGAPRRMVVDKGPRNEQNAVLLEIFKENLRLRGIEIDEPKAPVEPQADSQGDNTQAAAEEPKPEEPKPEPELELEPNVTTTTQTSETTGASSASTSSASSSEGDPTHDTEQR